MTRLRLLTITQKSPSWLNLAYHEYAKRLPTNHTLELVEIPLAKRHPSSNQQQLVAEEGKRMLKLIDPTHHVVALDVRGKLLTSEQFANKLAEWQHLGQDIDLLVGGPDGLAPTCLHRANERWSLSTLTFPHFFVRLIVIEQVYRAYSIQQQHPYHRE